jgi:hypothetical protein
MSRVVTLLLAFALAFTAGVQPAAAASKANGVTWSIDHPAKTITADVRITITPTCKPDFWATKHGLSGYTRCTVTSAIAAQIKANIESIWNGHNYYCYDVVVHVDIKVEDDPDATDPTDRVKVRIDQTPGSVVTNTLTRRAPGAWDSNSANDALTPMNNGAGSSTWAYPPISGRTNAYAHETGHILGLQDGYEWYQDANGQWQTRDLPGAKQDLMTDEANSNIDVSTIRRMVERAGYTKNDLKCNYKIDTQGNGSHVTGKKCDSTLDGQWTAKGTYSVGPADGKQEWITTMNGVTRKGNFVYSDRQVADFGGVITTTEGTAAGRATLRIDDELVAHFTLVEQAHTFTSTTNYGGKGHDQKAPLQSYDLVWQPIGKCPP